MTSTNERAALECLSSLHDMQRQVCDLTSVKCDGQLRVHVERQQGSHHDSVVISHAVNGRSLTLYLKPSGWLMVARNGNQAAWELALIGPSASLVAIIENRIEAFLLPRPVFQTPRSSVKQRAGARHADKRYAAR